MVYSKQTKQVLVIHGPNLNLLGARETSIYGSLTLKHINELLAEKGTKLGAELTFFQSNNEGDIVTSIQNAMNSFDGILINPAAYTHTSVAIRDALLAVNLPTIEVHMSNIYKREDFRHKSYISDIVEATIAGFGSNSYLLGFEGLLEILSSKPGVCRT